MLVFAADLRDRMKALALATIAVRMPSSPQTMFMLLIMWVYNGVLRSRIPPVPAVPELP